MTSIAKRLLAETPVGATTALPRAGTPLENPWVYDAVGRELRGLAHKGLIEIVAQQEIPQGDAKLLTEFAFRRVR